MQKILISLGIIIILAVGVFFVATSPLTPLLQGEGDRTNESLPISAILKTESGQEIQVRVADNDKERELGLSYFKSLPQDQGMLFVFDKPDIYPFWMKGMNFPLDILWLKSGQAGGYRVVYVAHNVLPSSYPDSINPKIEADAVLEINNGLASVYNLDLKKNLWITFK
jgi:uncharacterized membrane protein (UPF0127 family)